MCMVFCCNNKYINHVIHNVFKVKHISDCEMLSWLPSEMPSL